MNRLTWCILLAFIFSLLSITQAKTIRTVALTNSQAPGTPIGALFDDFSNTDGPVINDSGDTAFAALLRTGSGGVTVTNRIGLWSESNGTLGLVTRTGDVAPGTPSGVVFNDLNTPHFNNSGQLAFVGDLREGGVTNSNDGGIWKGAAGTLSLVAREGSQAPGTPSGAVYGNSQGLGSFTSLVFNDLGQASFLGRLLVGSGGVVATSDTGAWSDHGGSLALVGREGNQAPGVPAGANYNVVGNPVLNDVGVIKIGASLQTGSGGVTSDNNVGLWVEQSGALNLILRRGDPATGVPPGLLFSNFNATGFNDSSEIAFLGNLVLNVGGVTTNNDRGMWKQSGGTFALVAREGNQAPDTPAGTNFGEFLYGPVLNAENQTAFLGRLQIGSGGVTEINDTGIWSDASGTLELIAREGSHPVGTPANFTFADVLDQDFSPILNSAGQIAFMAPYWSGSVGFPGGERLGIWAQDDNGVLELIVREGGKMKVGQGDYRTVSLLAFQGGSGNQDGRRSGFNDSGELAFFARFTDGSEGVFVTQGPVTVPEPTSFFLALVMAIAIYARRQES